MEKQDNAYKLINGIGTSLVKITICVILVGTYSCAIIKPMDYYHYCLKYYNTFNRIIADSLLDHFPSIENVNNYCDLQHFSGCPGKILIDTGPELSKLIYQYVLKHPNVRWGSGCFDEMYHIAITICYLDSSKFLHVHNNIAKYRPTLYHTVNTDTNNIFIRLFFMQFQNRTCSYCNTDQEGRKPIPYFADYNFNLGSMHDSVQTDNGPISIGTYIIPQDLEIIVLDAQKGHFFDPVCTHLTRPESLGTWMHGFSKGFALSETNNMIVYWAIIW